MSERPMNYYLGIDVGSSKTHAMLADANGRGVGFGKAAGGNHQTSGYAGLERALGQSFQQALEMSGLRREQIAGAGFGVAGYDFPSDQAAHLQAVAGLGLSCRLEVVNDGLPGLLAGSTRGVGVNVTAGSGVNCRGRGPDGREGRIVGNGSHFGEYGGAAEIVLRGLHMVNYAWIRRIPPTALTGIYLQAAGASSELELMEMASNRDGPGYASLAIEIIRAAHAGDAAAGEVIRWAGEELGWLAVAVARQIDLQDDEVEIVMSGSIFEAGEILTQPMRQVTLRHCPRARLTRLDGPPVVGAVLLGMEQAGVDGYAVRRRLIDSAKEFLI